MTFETTPITCLITSGALTDSNFESLWQPLIQHLQVAVSEDVSVIQLREKRLCGRLLFRLADAAAELTRNSRTRLLINDRVDIAIAAGADGVHLTTRSMHAAIVRRRFPNLIISVSTHTQAEVVECREAGADLALFGPVFDTPGKGPAAGLKALADVCYAVDPFPVLALGGVDQTSSRSVLEAGAAGFAAIRSFNDIGSLRRIMGQSRN